MFGKKLVILLVLALVVLMVACSNVPAEPPVDGGAVGGRQMVGSAIIGDWNLVSLNGHDLVEGSTITASFDGLKITGSACNSYFGDYAVDVDTISFSNLGSTEMFCEDTSDQEREYFDALAVVNTWSVEGAKMQLSGDGVDLVFAQQVAPSDVSLEGTVWMLDSFIIGGDAVSSLEAGTSISATFADGQISGNATCNSYAGVVSLNGAGISISQIISTKMACQTGMDQEANYLQTLEQVSTWRIEGNTLTLSADSGNGLIFRAQQ
jgi:heat shock protein HslJ